MKIVATSFKRSRAHTAPARAAGHSQPTASLETSGQSWASLGLSLVGLPVLSPGSWGTQVLFIPSECLFPQFWN